MVSGGSVLLVIGNVAADELAAARHRRAQHNETAAAGLTTGSPGFVTAPIKRYTPSEGPFDSGGSFAGFTPFGGGFVRDQPARADCHLARAEAQVPHFEIHGLRDAVRAAKLGDCESRLMEHFAAGDFGTRHCVVLHENSWTTIRRSKNSQ
jgi:hypothetical protein